MSDLEDATTKPLDVHVGTGVLERIFGLSPSLAKVEREIRAVVHRGFDDACVGEVRVAGAPAPALKEGED